MLYRPLFLTSFMLADFLADNGFFGATRLLFSSASSKTAYGTAFCLRGQAGLALHALTSPRHRGFVAGLGCYGAVSDYAALESIDTATPTLYVDFSGDEALRERVHRHLGDALVYDCYAGSAQNTGFLREAALPGPAPAFFFAPCRSASATRTGAGGGQPAFPCGTAAIHRPCREPAHGWLTLVREQGFAAARERIASLAEGRAEPREGYVVRLGG